MNRDFYAGVIYGFLLFPSIIAYFLNIPMTKDTLQKRQGDV